MSRAHPFIDTDGDNTAQVMKADKGTLYGLHIQNPSDAAAYLQVFDAAAGDVTVGTTAPDLSFRIATGGDLSMTFDGGIAFAVAITYACTTTATGNGDPSTGLVVNAVVG